MTKKKAVVLLSGGLDSATALACAVRRDGLEAHCLTLNYGQLHVVEVGAARRVAASLKAGEHRIVNLEPGVFSGSALTGQGEVPKDRGLSEPGIPVTYVPARNLVFLSLALSWAEVLEAGYIYTGVTAVDYSGYPDCRPEFLEAFEHTANLATAAGVEKRLSFEIKAPLVALSKAEIIKLGLSLGVDYGLTHSCYDPDEQGRACGRCDACMHRLKGFEQAGIKDPVSYRPD